jgi:hypothetical protein
MKPNEYTFNPQLDLSLQQRLANDEVLWLSIYDRRSGLSGREFGNDGVDATGYEENPSNNAIISQSLILKMLKVI